ncbi:hypothetical protein MHA01_21910 [Marinococcus halophilus]|uniref:Uncharacterized protein n=1 Tax=Marinococcus halophilus TaxID=1371 RepID=A0A510Y7F0_MARHA|nr:hypothetical protein MHA01_21910 [Marinococcus halophilus]
MHATNSPSVYGDEPEKESHAAVLFSSRPGEEKRKKSEKISKGTEIRKKYVLQ